ncbi:MAG: DUF3459 domain-containing protein, partial [Burkholderiaceae bacterium]
HVHLVLENDLNEIDRLGAPGTPGRYDGQWSGDIHHALHVQLSGERDGYYAEYPDPVAQLGLALTLGFSRQGSPHGTPPRRAADRQAPLGAVINMLQTHDQIGNRAYGERLLALTSPEATRLAAAIVLLSPSVPMLFMGEEHGATTPFLYFCDWDGELREAVSAGRRREFEQFPRFADAARAGRLPDPCNVESFESSRLDRSAFASETARRWWRFHADLLALRARELRPRLDGLAHTGHAAHHRGSLLQVEWAFDGGRRLRMQVNLAPDDRRIDPADGFATARGEPLHAIGDIEAGHFGPWSGRWEWIA